MKFAASSYKFLQDTTLAIKNKNNEIIEFPQCLSEMNNIQIHPDHLFSKKINKEMK